MLLNAKEVKNRYSISRITLLKWEREGRIVPKRTPGGSRRYDEEEIKTVLGGNEVKMRSPIYDKPYIKLPRDTKELNQWCRHYYSTNPIVRTAIDFHAAQAVSGVELHYNYTIQGCRYEEYKEFHNTLLLMMRNLKLESKILEISKEYFKLGEVFIEMELDKSKKIWKNILIHNPDSIKVTSSIYVENKVELVHNEEIHDACFLNNLDGKNISHNPSNIHHIFDKESFYDFRGKPFMIGSLKTLVLYDRLSDFPEERKNIKQTLLEQFLLTSDPITAGVVEKKYEKLRQAISDWIDDKLFNPICGIHACYTKPILVWPELNLKNNKTYIDAVNAFSDK